MGTEEGRRFLTIQELADKLRTKGESAATVVRRIRLWVEKTDIPCMQSGPGGKLWFSLPEVLAWLKREKPLPPKRAQVYALPARNLSREVIQ